MAANGENNTPNISLTLQCLKVPLVTIVWTYDTFCKKLGKLRMILQNICSRVVEYVVDNNSPLNISPNLLLPLRFHEDWSGCFWRLCVLMGLTSIIV